MTSMTDAKDVVPSGQCHCGCNAPTKDGSFFLAGHDKKAESMLTKLKYGVENSVALRLADEGYGPGGKNLLAEYNKLVAASGSGRMEYFSLQSLNEMASKTGIAEAVVFTGPPGAPSAPTKTPGGDPQPEKSSFLEVPFLGSVVAQGFAKTLSKKEKEIVEARFKGKPSMWLSNR